jgi:hypothetical protein
MEGFSAGSIDSESGIIPDVVMVQEGPAKGHGVHLEAEFIEKMQKYDQKNYGQRGLKARFGHPSASGETMGTQLGIFKNFRTRSTNGKLQLIADLHLLDSSESSPTHPGMRSWVLSMAQERPDFMMLSIVFSVKSYYQRTPNGNKHNLIVSTDPFEGDAFSNYKEEWGNIFVEFAEHYYTDLVEAGAATDSLFSTEANPHLFVSKALSWLDEHPELKSFAVAHPEKVIDFLAAIGVKHQPSKPFKMNLKELFFGKEEPAEDIIMDAAAVKELRTNLSTLETKLADITKQHEDESKALNSGIAELESQLCKAQARIQELEKQPASEHTLGAKGTDGDQELKSFHKDAATARAIAAYEANKPKKPA